MLAFLSSAVAESDLETRFNFHIEAATLPEAIGDLSEQAGIQVMYPYDLAQNARTGEVIGDHTLAEAFGILFRDTGLCASRSSGGIYLITPAAQQMRQEGKVSKKISRKSLLARLASGVSSVIAVSGMGAGAIAQDGAESADGGRDEIVVTARFREESVQDMGMSVTGVSGDDIVRQGIRNFDDLSRTVVGLQTYRSRQNANDISIRGLRDAKGGIYASSSVFSIFLDDVSVASSGSQRDFSSTDLNRIEVIRGPQPTLFGEGAVGGVIRYFTSEPDLDGPAFSGFARGFIETIKSGGIAYGGETGSTFNLVPGKLGLRVSGFYRNDDGFIDNPSEGTTDVNDFENIGGRAVLLARPNDDLEIRLSAHLMRDDMGESNQIDPGSDAEDLSFGVSPRSGTATDDFDLYAGRVSYDLGSVEVVSITGYMERNQQISRFDPANTFDLVPFFETDTTSFNVTGASQEQWSQEFRFISDFDGPLNFTAGAYFRDRDSLTRSLFTGPGWAAVTEPSSPDFYKAETGTNSRQYSGFAELNFDVTDRLRLIGGARYVDDRVTSTIVSNEVIDFVLRRDMGGAIIPWTPTDRIGFTYPAEVLNDAGFGTVFNFHLKRFLPRGGAEFDVTDDFLLYANAAVGARNGGTGQPIAALAVSGGDATAFYNALRFDEDSVLSLEAGFKSSWLDDDLIVNVGVYRSKFKDTQISVQTPAFNVVNGPAQRILGLELETSYRVSDALSGFFNANIVDAEFTENFASVDLSSQGLPFDFDIPMGNAPENAPKLSFALGYNYDRPLGSSGLRLTSTGSFQFIGSRYSSNQNYPLTELDTIEHMNLRVGIENDRFSLNAYASNLLNDIEIIQSDTSSITHYVNSDGVLDSNPGSHNVNTPRVIGVSLTVRY